MLILRLSTALFAFALVTLAGCAHPNLTVQTQRAVQYQAANDVHFGFTAAELLRDVKVPYRPSDVLPIAEAVTPEPAEEIDVEENFDALYAAAFPAG